MKIRNKHLRGSKDEQMRVNYTVNINKDIVLILYIVILEINSLLNNVCLEIKCSVPLLLILTIYPLY